MLVSDSIKESLKEVEALEERCMALEDAMRVMVNNHHASMAFQRAAALIGQEDQGVDGSAWREAYLIKEAAKILDRNVERAGVTSRVDNNRLDSIYFELLRIAESIEKEYR